MKVKKLFMTSIAAALGMGVIGAAAASKTIEAKGESASDALIYRLDFADENNRAKNAVKNSLIGDAQIVSTDGAMSFRENEFKGKTAIVLPSTGLRTNYFALPNELMENETVTLGGWFKMDSGNPQWARLLTVNEWGTSAVSDQCHRYDFMPRGSEYFGQTKMDLYDGVWTEFFCDLPTHKDESLVGNTPFDKFAINLENVWINFVWVFGNNNFKVYSNGKLAFECYNRNMSPAATFNGDGRGQFVFGATFCYGDWDFKGMAADIRVYDRELTRDEIKSEFEFDYHDFLSTNYDFENGLNDSVRGYTGELVSGVTIEESELNGNKYLNFPGEKPGDFNPNRFKMVRNDANRYGDLIKGHHEITFSLDVNVSSSGSAWERIFETGSWTENAFLIACFPQDNKCCVKWVDNGERAEFPPSYVEFPMTSDAWHHLIISIAGDHISVYVDGVKVADTGYRYHAAALWDNPGLVCQLGGGIFWNDGPFLGKIDNFKLYSYALTDEDAVEETNENLGWIIEERLGELDNIVYDIYREAEQQLILEAAAITSLRVLLASSIEDIDVAYEDLYDYIATLKTNDDYLDIELRSLRETGVFQLKEFIESIIDNYDAEGRVAMDNIMLQAKEAFGECLNINDVNAVVDEYKVYVLAVPTAEENAERNAARKAANKVISKIEAFDYDAYRENDATELAIINAAAVVSLNEAKTLVEVEVIVFKYEEAVKAFKTAEYYEAQENAAAQVLTNAKSAELGRLNGVNVNAYREAERTIVVAKISTAKEVVNNATTVADAVKAVEDCLAEIALVKTNEQYKVEELAAAKATVLAKYKSFDLSVYSETNKVKVQTIINSTLKNIPGASDITTLRSIDADAEYRISEIQTLEIEKSNAALAGCGGSILATSLILTMLAAAGVSLLLLKRKELN